jgi:hypothetical protein
MIEDELVRRFVWVRGLSLLSALVLGAVLAADGHRRPLVAAVCNDASIASPQIANPDGALVDMTLIAAD